MYMDILPAGMAMYDVRAVPTLQCRVLEGPPGSSWIDSCKCPPPSLFHLPLFLAFTSPVIQF